MAFNPFYSTNYTPLFLSFSQRFSLGSFDLPKFFSMST